MMWIDNSNKFNRCMMILILNEKQRLEVQFNKEKEFRLVKNFFFDLKIRSNLPQAYGYNDLMTFCLIYSPIHESIHCHRSSINLYIIFILKDYSITCSLCYPLIAKDLNRTKNNRY